PRAIRAGPASWSRSLDRGDRCSRSPTRRNSWPRRCAKSWTPLPATRRRVLQSRTALATAEPSRLRATAGPPLSRPDIRNHDAAVDAVVGMAGIREIGFADTARLQPRGVDVELADEIVLHRGGARLRQLEVGGVGTDRIGVTDEAELVGRQ